MLTTEPLRSTIGFFTVATIVAVLAAANGLGMGPAKAEDTLRVGLISLPGSLGNPYGTYLRGWRTWTAMYDTLTTADPSQGKILPSLATEWKSVTDTAWQFKLRPGVLFDNGEPLDAAAVAASINWLLSDEGRTMPLAFAIRRVASARAIDDLTVEIDSVEPDAVMPARLSLIMIVAPRAWQDLGAAAYAKNPVGSGPFKPVSWAPDKIAFERSTNSWRQAHVDRLELLSLPERATRIQALLSGQTDVATNIAVSDIATVETAGHSISEVPSMWGMGIALLYSERDTPFADRRVRIAANLAVDKQALVDNLLLGHGKVSSQSTTAVTFGFDPSITPYPFDPDRARELLREAGYPDGFDIVIEVTSGIIPEATEIAQVAAQDLSRVGINVELRKIAYTDWVGKWVKTSWEGEAFVFGWGAYLPDSIGNITIHSCEKVVPWFCDESLTPAIAGQYTMFDPKEREAALQALFRIYHEEAPFLFLVDTSDLAGSSERLRNFRNTGNTFNYDEVSIED